MVLLGLMGTGKTSVGTLLAERVHRPLRDSDRDLLATRGMTASEVLERHGSRDLHAWEAAHLMRALAQDPPAVVCAAASVIDQPECRRALMAPFAVWLTAPPDVLAARFTSSAHRPRYRKDLVAMLTEQEARRAPDFAAVADLVVDVAVIQPDEVVEKILGARR